MLRHRNSSGNVSHLGGTAVFQAGNCPSHGDKLIGTALGSTSKKKHIVNNHKIQSVAGAIEYFEQILSKHPERDLAVAQRAVLAGERRKYSALTLTTPGCVVDQSDTSIKPGDEWVLPTVEIQQPEESAIGHEIIGMLKPLERLNPVKAAFNLGKGTGTLVPCFGIPLNPECGNVPAFHKSLDQCLADGSPDAEKPGLLPEMLRKIECVKANTPDAFKIALPDMQGPFNIAHMVLGDEAFFAPFDQKEKFYQFMKMITELWLQVYEILVASIGEERLDPWFWNRLVRECSVNMVSAEMYKEHILPHDIKIAENIGSFAVHPCAGPHVFHVTLENIPHLQYTEAGFIEDAFAGSISVDEALDAIGDRQIVLSIGQELPEGSEFEFIRNDLARYRDNPLLLFHYIGMYWRRKDFSFVRNMHNRLDEYWDRYVVAVED